MKTSVYLGIALRIILLFTVGAFMTFLPELLRGFFGDVQFKPYYETDFTGGKYLIDYQRGSTIDDGWIWETRHYWYFWMMVLLFILSCINVIISIVELIKKEYPNIF